MIEIQDLNYSYEDGRHVLRQVCVHISRGEKVALVGPNGAGKSTLLLHLNGLLRGDGCVRLGGQELNAGNLKAARARVGLVFQSPDDQLFSASVFEDVAYGLVYQGLPQAEITVRVARVLAAVGMAGSEERRPHLLSLGEKKRVALASVLVMQPQVLALDEPTAGLDPRGRREIIALLAGLDQTILAATHDLAMAAEIFPRVLIMDAGAIVFDGAAEQVLADRSLLLAHGLA